MRRQSNSSFLARAVALSFAISIASSPFLASDAQARGLLAPSVLVQRVRATYASAVQGLRARIADFKAINLKRATGSIEGFREHSRNFSQASRITMDTRVDRRGRSQNIDARQVSEVLSSRRGLQRYLAFVGKSTVELIYKDNSDNGHLMIRAGQELYEFNGRGSARHMPFLRKLRGESEWVGMVYEVKPEQLSAIQAELSVQVENTVRHNLPPFDGGGRPARLERHEDQFRVTGDAQKGLPATGRVTATLVNVGEAQFLRTPTGYQVPARIKGDVVEVDTLNCTSFPILTLARLLPDRGFDKLHRYTQTRATQAVSNMVRGTTTAKPDLVTVYKAAAAEPMAVLERLWHVGKKSPAAE